MRRSSRREGVAMCAEADRKAQERLQRRVDALRHHEAEEAKNRRRAEHGASTAPAKVSSGRKP